MIGNWCGLQEMVNSLMVIGKLSQMRIQGVAGGILVALSLASCSIIGPSGSPSTTPTASRDLPTKTQTVGELTLEIPESWEVGYQKPTGSPSGESAAQMWDVVMTDPHSDEFPTLTMSGTFPAESPEQAAEVSQTLLMSSLPGYRSSSLMTLPGTNLKACASGSPSHNPTTTEPSTSGGVDNQNKSAPGNKQRSERNGCEFIRSSYFYQRDNRETQGMAWTVPVLHGYVVIVLLKVDDSVANKLESSIADGGS